VTNWCEKEQAAIHLSPFDLAAISCMDAIHTFHPVHNIIDVRCGYLMRYSHFSILPGAFFQFQPIFTLWRVRQAVDLALSYNLTRSRDSTRQRRKCNDAQNDAERGAGVAQQQLE
jgi:hypothetical protein